MIKFQVFTEFQAVLRKMIYIQRAIKIFSKLSLNVGPVSECSKYVELTTNFNFYHKPLVADLEKLTFDIFYTNLCIYQCELSKKIIRYTS